MHWKSLASSMGSLWRPKCTQVRKKHSIELSPPPFWEPFLAHFQKHLEKNHSFFLSFFRPSIWILFPWFLLNFGSGFPGLARVLGKSWKQRFCNTFYVKSQIRARWLNVVCILTHFSRTPSERVFLIVLGVSRCHFWLAFGAQGCFRSGLGGIGKMMHKRVWTNPRELPIIWRKAL